MRTRALTLPVQEDLDVFETTVTVPDLTARCRLEHLRGSALGFCHLTNDIASSLVATGGFRPRLRPGS